MKRIWFAFLAVTLVLGACQPEEGGIEAHDYWIRAAARSQNSALYMLLHNHSAQSDELTEVSSDVAEAVEIHETTVDGNGVAQMGPVVAVILDPDAEIYFEPAGLHVMFVNLKQDLISGDHIQVTLHFKIHKDIVLTVAVQEGGGGSQMNMP